MIEPDEILISIADYVCSNQTFSEEAYQTASYALIDSIGCALLALNYPECKRILGPIVKGATMEGGSRVIGTNYILDPVQAAFNMGSMIRWLDFNDTWLAAEWGHPSDNLGGILAVANYLKTLSLRDVLTAMIKAYEIQGILALNNSFNREGFDHVILVKIATAAVATQMLGGDRDAVIAALSQAFIDNGPLRTYRHAPNTGSRKSWAAGDATSRGVWLALITLRGEMGYMKALTAKEWGFQDVVLKGKPLKLPQPLNSYVMENILFKVSYPAEFHAQTAVECTLKLHPEVKNRLDQIETIEIETQESAMRIINKTGPLRNPADRDHCLQYMVAVPLIYGNLTADHYQDEVSQDPYIDELRKKMVVRENEIFSRDYLDPEKRSIANSVKIRFSDGSQTDKIVVEYPIGHRKRRNEAIPLIKDKFIKNGGSNKTIDIILGNNQDKMFSDIF